MVGENARLFSAYPLFAKPTKEQLMIYAYIRVSTDKQTTENQRWEIQQFCEREHIVIDEWIAETISATKDLKKRKLGKLIRRVKKDDLIIASELSRLGRNLLQVMGILNGLLDTDARVWTIKDNYKLGDDIPSKVLAFAFGLSAEIERKMISQRTREALAARRAAGVVLGRPCGSRSAKTKLSSRESEIARLLALGWKKISIARRFRVHRDTLREFINAKNIVGTP
jgi:DNA invertase Pin-like site-specific DNA recombinase